MQIENTITNTAPPVAPLTLAAKRRRAKEQIDTLLKFFIPQQQLAFTVQLMRGEEGEYFMDKLDELHTIIANLPKVYEQDGKGDDAIVYLHYFGVGDWYITEKDPSEDEGVLDLGDGKERKMERGEQWQAFGWAKLSYGEWGYISIQELCETRGLRAIELDYHFTPTTVRELKAANKIS